MSEHTPIPWIMPDNDFSKLVIPTRAFKQQEENYRVYSSKTEFVDVKAETIAEAMQSSGIVQPLKVERLGIKQRNIYDSQELQHLSGYGSAGKMQRAMMKTAQKSAENAVRPPAEPENSAGQAS